MGTCSPDWTPGMAALKSQVSKNVAPGLNQYEFFGGRAGVCSEYAPSADATGRGLARKR